MLKIKSVIQGLFTQPIFRGPKANKADIEVAENVRILKDLSQSVRQEMVNGFDVQKVAELGGYSKTSTTIAAKAAIRAAAAAGAEPEKAAPPSNPYGLSTAGVYNYEDFLAMNGRKSAVAAAGAVAITTPIANDNASMVAIEQQAAVVAQADIPVTIADHYGLSTTGVYNYEDFLAMNGSKFDLAALSAVETGNAIEQQVAEIASAALAIPAAAETIAPMDQETQALQAGKAEEIVQAARALLAIAPEIYVRRMRDEWAVIHALGMIIEMNAQLSQQSRKRNIEAAA